MKILRLLNKTFLSILISLFFIISNSYAEDQPVDIWNIDKSKINKKEEIQNNSECARRATT